MVDDDRLPSPDLFYQSELLLPTLKPNPEKRWTKAGTCPFCDSCRPNRFVINLESGAFKCSSCGAKGGGIIAFRMRRHDICFRVALDSIRDEWRLLQ